MPFQEKSNIKDSRFFHRWQNAFWLATCFFIWLFFWLFSIGVQKNEALLAVCFLGIFILLTSKYHFEKGFRPNRTTPWLLFLLCFASRWAWCAFMLPQITQVSDFAVYLETAAGNFDDPAYLLFPHKAIYPLLLRMLGITTQGRALFLQCLCVAGIPPLLYHIGRRIKNEKLGLLSALIYLVWPGQFIYITVVTDEHVAALMLTALTALLLDVCHAITSEDIRFRSIWVKLVCIGVLCGVCALFWSFALILPIAAVLGGMMLLPGQKRGTQKTMVLAAAILLLSHTAAHTGLTSVLSGSTGLQMGESRVTAQMYWSLDPNGWGGYTVESAQEYSGLAEKYDYDLEQANREAMQVLREKIGEGWYKLPNLLLSKGISSYADDEAMFSWSGAGILPEAQSDFSGGLSALRFAGRIFYLMLVLCLLLCTFYRNRDILFILLVSVGAIMAGLLVECQGRYKYCVEPLWSLAAAYVLYILVHKSRETALRYGEMAVSGCEKPVMERLREMAQEIKTVFQRWMTRKSYTAFCLCVIGLAVGMLALGITAYSCPALDSGVLFQSYVNSGFLLLVNLLPCVLLIWLGYFLFHRVWAAYLFCAIPTLGLALVNYYKVKLRDDPLYPADLLLVRTVGGVIGRYSLPITGVVIFAAGCFAVVLLGCIFLCKRKGTLKIWQRICGLLCCVVISCSVPRLYTEEELWVRNRYLEYYRVSDIAEHYVTRGIWYPFIHHIQNMFRVTPEGYDSQAAREAYLSYEGGSIPEEKKVNITGVMLEAFSDLTDFPAVAEQPGVMEIYQPLHDLEQRSIHGDLLTDIFAGGTCITERASLTGSNAYSSFLTDIRSNEDSYVWYLRSQGYRTVFTHPNVKWMYNRQNIVPWLGFEDARFYEDSFSSQVDQMDAMIRSDDLLFDLLLEDAAEHSAQDESAPMFSFSVSYQNHGPYSESELAWQEIFPEEGSGLSHESWAILNNYLGGISYTIQQLVRFTEELETYDEPYVVYFFGDHKPWLGNEASVYYELGVDLDYSTLDGYYNYYGTPYLIWANSAAREVLGRDFTGEGGDFSPCFLMQELFDACGWDGPGFMELSRDMRNRLPLISFHDVFLENGQLTDTLSPDAAAAYEQYQFIQYYRKRDGLKELYGE